MSRTLKEILDEVMLESGMDTEAEYAGSSIDAVKRLVSMANAASRALSKNVWQAMLKTHEFTLTSATSYALPSDYKRMIPDTMYSDSHLWPVEFPTGHSKWAYLQASAGGTGTQDKIRLMGDTLQIYQPEAGKVIRVEYMSENPVQAADATTKKYFTADTDTFVLDDDLLLMETMWRYQRLLGLEFWQGTAMEAKDLLNVKLGDDAGAQTIQHDWDVGGIPYYDLWRPVPNTT
jgi:hypothetical protein